MNQPTHDDLQRSLGRVEGNQDSMEKRMDRFERLVSEGFEKLERVLGGIEKRLDVIEDKEIERKTAWRVVAAVATVVSAAVSALVGWIVKLLV